MKIDGFVLMWRICMRNFDRYVRKLKNIYYICRDNHNNVLKDG